MTDIVERLREPRHCVESINVERREAANEIERLREFEEEYYKTMLQENLELRHMQANLHGHIKRLEDEKSALALEIARSDTGGLRADNLAVRTENAKLREALAWTVDPDCDCEICRKARAALQKDEGE